MKQQPSFKPKKYLEFQGCNPFFLFEYFTTSGCLEFEYASTFLHSNAWAASLPKLSCVYLGLRPSSDQCSQVVYVGQTCNLLKRVMSTQSYRPLPGDKLLFFPVLYPNPWILTHSLMIAEAVLYLRLFPVPVSPNSFYWSGIPNHILSLFKVNKNQPLYKQLGLERGSRRYIEECLLLQKLTPINASQILRYQHYEPGN